ncbi:hypothetical protein PSN45_000720 [Yamadazyma tenuis]|uniref:uncharacterized protein n=1 Tax=Candida tenuis TaxID=2315449 RepID=UPI0027992EC0|nr:hypothetical protein PSN45_000720 [Yamadazyma tenuis]
MDFEEQLEKAEKSESPSLVGSSVRSADDSPHNNYIHPEKYKGVKSSGSPAKKSGLSKDITASLDDLMREGALIASEENFEDYLDPEGAVKDDAKYSGSPPGVDEKEQVETTSTEKSDVLHESVDFINSVADTTEAAGKQVPPSSTTTSIQFQPLLDDTVNNNNSVYSQADYSNPNLSEYQLNNQIQNHEDLLAKVKREDPHLKETRREKNEEFRRPEAKTQSSFNPLPLVENGQRGGPEGFHSPYFFKDTRAESVDRSRSRSTSRSRGLRPHLARGDSYKYTKDEDPSKYELPPDYNKPIEEERDERRSRQSRPTMGESIAAVEEEKINNEKYQSQLLSREHSLLTTGDYTNFNVDNPSREPSTPYQFKSSAYSTDYLRSISRSRSRQPHFDQNEKNDANPAELYKEGALINEDPYSAIDNFDSLVDKAIKAPTKTEVKDTSEELEVADEQKEEPETSEEPKAEEVSDEVTGTEVEKTEPEKGEDVEEIEPKEEENLGDIQEDKEPEEIASDEKEESVVDTKSDVGQAVEEAQTDRVSIEESKEVSEEVTKIEESKEVSDDLTKKIEVAEESEKTSSETVPVTEIKAIDIKDDDFDDFDVSPEELRKHLESQPVYLFTSLIGGMQIIHKTNRLQTILKANEIQFTARDLGTDDEAKKIWRRYSNGKTLPGIVRGDDFIGNWEDFESANEEYRVRELLYETL